MKFKKLSVLIAVVLSLALLMPVNVLAVEDTADAAGSVAEASKENDIVSDGAEDESIGDSGTSGEKTEITVYTEPAGDDIPADSSQNGEVLPVNEAEETGEGTKEETEGTEEETEGTEEETEEVKNGLVEESDGHIYFYIDGEAFTEGYKEVINEDGSAAYYYFQKNGQAYTDGFLEFKDNDGKTCYCYFESNGQAFTGGYKCVDLRAYTDENNDIIVSDDRSAYRYYFQNNGLAFTDGLLEFVHTNGKTYYYYFQSNGQAFTGGYKCLNSRFYTDGESDIVKINDNKGYHYYFQSNGQAFTGGLLEFVHTNGKTYYFYFQSNGQAYTNGFKTTDTGSYTDGKSAVVNKNTNKTIHYYYFQSNGQAFNRGLLEFVHTNGKTYYFYFQSNGQAYTNGFKGTNTGSYTDGKSGIVRTNQNGYYYYFQSNGQAYTKGYLKYKHTDGKSYIGYFQSNARAYTGGWKTIGDAKYYFANDGRGYIGLKKINNKNYYFDANGKVQSGWVQIGDKWYYFDETAYTQKFQSNVLYNAWKKIQSKSSNTKYFIVVDTDNTQTMIFKGSKNNWVPVYNWNCSVGKSSTPTVKGTFTVGIKGYSFGSGFTCYYYTQFYGDYLFHSVLYHEGTFNIRNGRLGAHNSHGCVRLDIKNAKWIYDNIPAKTKVYIY